MLIDAVKVWALSSATCIVDLMILDFSVKTKTFFYFQFIPTISTDDLKPFEPETIFWK